MRVLVLFDLARATPPDQQFSAKALRTEEDKPTEADVLLALRRLGHDVETLAVYDNVRDVINRIDTFKPNVVFNLCESFYDERAHEANVPALLELMRVPYTGAGSDALLLCKDKALAKKLLAFHHIRVARFVVSAKESPKRKLARFHFPAFVKPVAEESSDGIAKASLANTEEEALERARFIHERFGCDALIEEYIEGRELYVGVVGNKRLTVLPPREIFFGEPPEPDAPRFATAKAKWDDAYRKKWGIRNGPAAPIPKAVQGRLGAMARRICRVLHLRGVARLDLRLTPEGDWVVIEANPNPSLARGDDFAQSALAAGMDYDTLIARILDNALL